MEIKNPFGALTSVEFEEAVEVPTSYSLRQHYPNPFKEVQRSGIYRVRWGAHQASGLYFCKLHVQTPDGHFEKVVKMILAK